MSMRLKLLVAHQLIQQGTTLYDITWNIAQSQLFHTFF